MQPLSVTLNLVTIRLQIVINNVHLRFEHDQPQLDGSRPSFGCLLQRISITSTDANWNPKYAQVLSLQVLSLGRFGVLTWLFAW